MIVQPSDGNRAKLISGITGWLVLGIAYHDDTEIIHLDYMLSRYSAPQPAEQSPRNREDACKLLGDRKGLRKVGPCVTGFFRYLADGHEEIVRPGLSDDAIRKLKAHQRRYRGEVPLDVQAALALDQEVRDKFTGIPDFDLINHEWYLARARIQRKMATKKLNDLFAHEQSLENKAESVSVVTSLLNHYVHNGLPGLDDAVSNFTSELTKELTQRVELLSSEQSAITEKLHGAMLLNAKLVEELTRHQSEDIGKKSEFARRYEVLELRMAEIHAGSYEQQAELNTAKNINSDLLSQNQFLKERFTDLVDRSTTLQRDNKEINALNTDLRLELASAGKELMANRGLLQSNEIAMNEMSRKLALSMANALGLQEDRRLDTLFLTELETENATLKTILAANDHRIKALETQVKAVGDKNDQLGCQNADLKIRIAEEAGRTSRVMIEGQLVEKRNEELESLLSSESDTNKVLLAKNYQLDTEATKTVNALSAQAKDLASSKATISDLQQQVKVLVAEKQVSPPSQNLQHDESQRIFHLYEVHSAALVCSGPWEDLERYWNEFPGLQPALHPVEVTSKAHWLVENLPQSLLLRREFVDLELAQHTNDRFLLGLLNSRFPELRGLGVIDKAMQNWGPDMFLALRKRTTNSGAGGTPDVAMSSMIK